MINCALCNHSHPVSIVEHIRESHDLKAYLNVFPDLPIVSNNLFVAIENAVYFGYNPHDLPELENISIAEREMILVSSRNNLHLRSEIFQAADF